MSRAARIITSLVVAVVLAGLVTGVAFWAASVDPDAADPPGLYVDGLRVEDPDADPLVRYGNKTVPFDVYRYFFLYYKWAFEYSYGDSFFDSDPDGDNAQQLKSYVNSQLQNLYAWLTLADEMGLELDEDDLAEAEASLQEIRDQYGDDTERFLREERYVTDEATFLEIQHLILRLNKAQEEYKVQMEELYGDTAGDEAEQAYRDARRTTQDIFIRAGVGTEASEQAKADALEEAEALVAQLQAYDDPDALAAAFEALQAGYTGDVDAEDGQSASGGHTFTETGSLAPVLIETAFELDEYELGGPVWYEPPAYRTVKHILIRVDTDDEQAKADALAMAESLTAQLRAYDDPDELVAAFEELQAEYTDDVDVNGAPNSPDGYTFTETDSYVPVFIETAFGLDEYELGDPAWNDSYDASTGTGYRGWHIILRLPLDEAAVAAGAGTENIYPGWYVILRLPLDEDAVADGETTTVAEGIESARSTAITNKVNEVVNEKIAELMEQNPPTYGDNYWGLLADSIR